MNKLILSGTLARPIEYHDTSVGGYVRNAIAVKSNIKNDNGEYETEFFEFTIFGKSAEVLRDWAEKGCKVVLEAHLRFNDWTDKDNKKHHDLKIMGDRLELLTFKSRDNSSSVPYSKPVEQQETADENVDKTYEIADEDLPF